MSDRDEQDETDREDTLYALFSKSLYAHLYGQKVGISGRIAFWDLGMKSKVFSGNSQETRGFVKKQALYAQNHVKNVKSEGKNFS